MLELWSCPMVESTSNESKKTCDNLNSDHKEHLINQRSRNDVDEGRGTKNGQEVERNEHMKELGQGDESTAMTGNTPNPALTDSRYETFDEVNNNGNLNQKWLVNALEILEDSW